MTNLETRLEALLPEKTIIIDWYDGIVTALIQFNGIGKWCLIDLLAWDSSQTLKVFALRVLTNEESDSLLRKFEDQQPTWPIWIPKNIGESQFFTLKTFNSTLDREGFSEDYVFLAADVNKGVQGIKKMPNRKVLFSTDIEQIMNMNNEEREYWYGLFK
jgi:hypothetical protein